MNHYRRIPLKVNSYWEPVLKLEKKGRKEGGREGGMQVKRSVRNTALLHTAPWLQTQRMSAAPLTERASEYAHSLHCDIQGTTHACINTPSYDGRKLPSLLRYGNPKHGGDLTWRACSCSVTLQWWTEHWPDVSGELDVAYDFDPWNIHKSK